LFQSALSAIARQCWLEAEIDLSVLRDFARIAPIADGETLEVSDAECVSFE
jgi:hypothetical protein